MGDWVTSKTHRYISVRQFPSDYILGKFHKNDRKASRKMMEYAREFLKFHEDLIEFSTGNDYQTYKDEYLFGTKDATKEELHELTGIISAESGNNVVYCIPKTEENERIFDWIIENCPFKYKVLQKTRGTYMDHGPSTFFRDMNRTSDEIRNLLNKNK